jgi:hypothetical protein
VLALLASLACSAAPACDLFLGSSRVAQGQLYQADDQRYDPYFDSVHQAQIAAAAWPDEKKAARRPLVNALTLTPGSSDDTVVSATRTRVQKRGGQGAKLDVANAHVTPSPGATDYPLFAAVEETVRLELDRARKLKEKSDKLDEMSKRGEELKSSADKEYENRGADKADEKKTAKSRELRRELGGAVDVTRSLSRDALKRSREAQEFLEDLESALEAKDAPPRGRAGRGEPKPLPPPKAEPPKEEKKPEEVKPSKPAKPAPPPPKSKPPADKPPADKPAPAKPPPDEVFNP